MIHDLFKSVITVKQPNDFEKAYKVIQEMAGVNIFQLDNKIHTDL